MGIKQTGTPNVHWTFFTAIESDVEKLVRYVEPVEANFSTYSMEISRVLFAACSECEIVLKEIAKVYGYDPSEWNIWDLHKLAMEYFPGIASEAVTIRRYGLDLLGPWDNWAANPPKSPFWWAGYNAVKHDRVNRFEQGNLLNALNAVGALYVVTLYYYGARNKLMGENRWQRRVVSHMAPASTLYYLKGFEIPEV